MNTTARRTVARTKHRARKAGRLPLGPGAQSGMDPSEVYERILGAIMDHSLPPETRLVEGDLCRIFGLGRTRMRQVLQRLAHDRVVTLMRNRGAMVARPSVREAREVFAARRIIERGIVETFLDCATAADLRGLQEHVEREEKAWREQNRRAMLTLSGEFHMLIAEAAGNDILTDLLRDLVSRSALIIAVYQSPATVPCPPDDHRQLVALLRRRDPASVQLMLEHIDHVLADLRLEQPRPAAVDLHSVFASASGSP